MSPGSRAARPDGILLVGHGSRDAGGEEEIRALGRLVAAARPDLLVETGFLEMSAPSADEALGRLVARQPARVGVVPLMLGAAGHVKSDVPAIVLEGRAAYPELPFSYGRPLGADYGLVAAAGRRLAAAGARGRPLVVVARGTSEPEANAEAYQAARLVAEWTEATTLAVGFSGLTWPTVEEAVAEALRVSEEPIGLFCWFLADGVLVERARQAARRLAAAAGREIFDAGYLGPEAAVEVVLERLEETLGGRPAMTCDVCAYRRPWPGREDRVGQPRGVGHSHLAATHRHAPVATPMNGAESRRADSGA